MDSVIHLSKSAYWNMIRGAVEVFPKEVDGFIVGRKKSKTIIFNSYSFQTSKRKPTQVETGNYNALQRLRDLENVWADNETGGYLGGFHSHTTFGNTLSKGDIDSILGEMKALGKESWIEIVLRIASREHLIAGDIGEKRKNVRRRIESVIYDNPFHSYRIIFSAFNINLERKVSPSTLILDEIKIHSRKSLTQ